MPLALWTLLWLNARAGLRRTGRQARTVRGLVLLVLGVGVVGLWLVPTVLSGRGGPRADPAVVRAVGPVVVLGFVVLNLISSAGERAVSFTPVEVDFLFPGPFTRRQLLAYKLVKTGLGGIIPAALFGLFRARYGASYPTRVAGIWLTFQFLQLLAIIAALVQTSVGERVFGRGRWWVLAAGLAIVVVIVAPGAWRARDARPAELAGRLDRSTAGRVLLAPFTLFARAITAERVWPDGLAWLAGAAATDAALVAVVVRLDANYLETAAAASGRRYDRVARVRRAGLAGMATPASARLRVPGLPWAGGVGPVAWRQLTAVVRTSRGLLVVTGIIAVAVGGTVSHSEADPASAMGLLGVSVWANLFLSSLLRFDFRGDVDHLDVLRSLPLRPTAVAAAELVAPTAVLSAVQGLLIGAVAVFGHVPPWWLATAAVFVVPVNGLLMAIENLMFLLFPFRSAPAVAGDMGMVGRQSVVFFCRLVGLLSVGGVAVACGVGGYLLTGGRLVRGHRGLELTGGSAWVAGVATWVPLAVAIAGIVLLLGLVYDRFDPSVDTPA